MGFLEKLYLLLDAFNHKVGRATAWIAVVMVLVQFSIVVLRYVFSISFIWMQESVIYLHSFLFMVGVGYTLLHEGHVRVDIFYQDASERQQAWVDFFGALLLLLPISILVWWWTWPYVALSWSVFEGSKETSGIQAVFLLKSLILVFSGLLTVQGISMMLRTFLTLSGHKTRHAREDGAQI